MHVAVLGAGYAGITLVRKLESRLPPDVEITLVDERDTHLVQHLIHRIVREPDLAADLQIPIAEVVDRATHRQATVEAVDPGAGTVDFDDGDLSYGVGAVCLGARTAFHGIPGVAEHGMPLKRARHARAIRARFLEVAERGSARVVVGGAGTSGVQVAGELAELAAEEGVDAEIEILEQRETVVPTFPETFQAAVREELESRDVRVRTGTTVAGADEGVIRLEDAPDVAYDQFVWTGGITGRRAMGSTRPRVPATLQLASRTLALGDAAAVVDDHGTAVPASAQTAVNQASVAARNVETLVDHARTGGGGFDPRLARYTDDPRGWLVSVGDAAVAQLGPQVLRGTAAKAIKRSVGVGYLGSVGGGRGVVDVVRDHLR